MYNKNNKKNLHIYKKNLIYLHAIIVPTHLHNYITCLMGNLVASYHFT